MAGSDGRPHRSILKRGGARFVTRIVRGEGNVVAVLALLAAAQGCGDRQAAAGHDCLVHLALNGRVVTDTEWEPWPQAVATEADNRHECIGGIIQRPYSSGQIAEMRSGLRLIRI